MNIPEFQSALNEWGRQGVPFLFMVDFEMKNPVALRLDQIDPEQILYNFNGITNAGEPCADGKEITISKHPIPLEAYRKKFDTVLNHLHLGDSYLVNLTIKTQIKINASLKEIFYKSTAKYKLLYKDKFLVFSPEMFVRIKDSLIYTYPMKGTIDATAPDAERIILENQKELAEHVTIVDLLRNDLSLIADNVLVARFRYVDKIITNSKHLLQVSSEVVGQLPRDYCRQLGTLLIKLLPAGSITGAPKKKTADIITDAEGEPRGYYTGITGIFDGRNLDSGVMIRFIEKINDQYFYRSGGGITTQSICENEYQEAIDKIYVPVN